MNNILFKIFIHQYATLQHGLALPPWLTTSRREPTLSSGRWPTSSGSSGSSSGTSGSSSSSECIFYVYEVPTFTLISPRPGWDEGGCELFEEEVLPGKGPFRILIYSIIVNTDHVIIITTTIATFVIIINAIIWQEYSEEDIHRAIGICAINSVTLEPRRLFQGPAKGQFWEIWSKYSCLKRFTC